MAISCENNFKHLINGEKAKEDSHLDFESIHFYFKKALNLFSVFTVNIYVKSVLNIYPKFRNQTQKR